MSVELRAAREKSAAQLLRAAREQYPELPVSWQLRVTPAFAEATETSKPCLNDLDLVNDMSRASVRHWFEAHAREALHRNAAMLKARRLEGGGPVVLLRASPWRPRPVSCGRPGPRLAADLRFLAALNNRPHATGHWEGVASFSPLDAAGSVCALYHTSDSDEGAGFTGWRLARHHLSFAPTAEHDPGPAAASACGPVCNDKAISLEAPSTQRFCSAVS